MPKQFESPSFEKENNEEMLKRILETHIVDIDTKDSWEGSKELKKKVSGGYVGAADAEISRCEPPLEVPEVSLIGGKSVVLVGPNGSGKSTFFDAVMRRDNAYFSNGAHGYNKGIHAKESLRIARLNQEEILGKIENLGVDETLKLAEKHFKKEFPVDWEDLDAYDANLANQDAQQRIEELIGKIGKLFEVDLFLDRKVKELSGGERTKLSLLMILCSEPDVLLLDEPTNHLDLESISKLMGLFELYKRAGLSIVSVSHVEWFLNMIGNDGTLELQLDKDGGRTLVSSNSPFIKYAKKEKGAPVIKEPIHWNNEAAQRTNPSLFDTDPQIRIPKSPLKEIVLPTIQGRDLVVFSGKNGTGKTKLMEEIARKNSGIIRKEKGTQIAYMPQFWPEDVAGGTVEDFFDWVKSSINPHSEKMSSRFLKELRDLGFGYGERRVLKEKLSSFSGGEQRLLWFVAASILEGTDALILDEPSNHMDSKTMLRVVEAIRNFKGSVILSTHDLRLMEELEKKPGDIRANLGVKNIVFEREGGETGIRVAEDGPATYAKKVIEKAKTAAGRIKL